MQLLFKSIVKSIYSYQLVLWITAVGLGTFNQVRSQSKHAIDEGCIVKTQHHGKIRGSLVGQNEKGWVISNYQKDTITVLKETIRKIYFPDEITLFARKRFHYKKGRLLNHSFGIGLGAAHWNLSYNRRFTTKFEAGFGLGVHNNSFYFNTSNSQHWVFVGSCPLYVHGKYIFSSGKKLWYGKARAGWANNFNSSSSYDLKDGFLFEGGIGLTFKSKTRMKRYLEMTQYFAQASGMAADNSAFALSDIGFKVWFVSFMITYGIEIGR